MQKYVIDTKKRNYLISSAYKETCKWKKGKAKRRFAYLCLFFPILLYILFLVINLSQGENLGIVISKSLVIPAVVMIITWSIALIILKTQYHNAKIIPENRKDDEIIVDSLYMIYTYSNLTDGYMYETRINFTDVSHLQYSETRHTFYIFTGYDTKVTYNGKLVKEFRLGKESGQYIDVPMYFVNSKNLMEQISSLSKVENEIIEKL